VIRLQAYLRHITLAIAGLATFGVAAAQVRDLDTASLQTWQPDVAFRPDQQSKLSRSSESWDVTITSWKSCPEALSNECFFFRISNKVQHTEATFKLANQTAQIDALRIVSPSRLVILGKSLPNLSIVTIVAMSQNRELDGVVCEKPTISPDGRYLAYLKFAPVHPGYGWSTSAEYLIYDLSLSPQENRTRFNSSQQTNPYNVGWPLYPPGTRNMPGDNLLEGQDVPVHWSISPFFWVSSSEVAFVDRWHGSAYLVLASLSQGIQHPVVRQRELNVSELIDFPACKNQVSTEDFQGWSKDPVVLISVERLELPRDKSGQIVLHLARNVCLRTDTVEIPIDSGFTSVAVNAR
jgi:hypothetical protein